MRDLKAPIDSSIVTLENDFLKASFSLYGASLISLIYKPLNRETVCGFTSVDDLKKQSFYLGAVVGRVANRIENGQFLLNNHRYSLPINNGHHHLHGGTVGFNQAHFRCVKNGPGLLFTHISPAMDQGYPGELKLEMKVQLNQNSLILEFDAESDQDTLSDPTLHTYFNLNENHSKSIRNHSIKVNAEVFYGLSETGCTIDAPLPVNEILPKLGTKIETVLTQNHPQLHRAKGLDHYFLKKDECSPLVLLRSEDLSLEIETDLPGCHIYSGNYLGPTSDLSADFLQENGAICFETHHIPNSINFSLKDAPILKAHTQQHSYTQYTFKGVEHD